MFIYKTFFYICSFLCKEDTTHTLKATWNDIYKVNAVRRKERGLAVLKQALYILEGSGERLQSAERRREQRARINK